MKAKVRVKKFSGMGSGLIASQEIEIEDIIGEVTGERSDSEGSEYSIDMGDYTLEPGRPFRFLNHSCEPNAALTYYEDEPDRLYVEALKPISKGDAVTIDYAWPAEATIPCLCGAAKCRGWVVAKEDLPRLRRMKAKENAKSLAKKKKKKKQKKAGNKSKAKRSRAVSLA